MSDRWIAWIVTVTCLALVAAHLKWPGVAIDGVTATLIGIAVIPWLRPLFKSIELPGGVKVEFQELKAVEEQAARAGLLAEEVAPSIDDSTAFSFQRIASQDPNLALAGLRIELERRLQALAAACGIETRRQGVGALLRSLT